MSDRCCRPHLPVHPASLVDRGCSSGSFKERTDCVCGLSIVQKLADHLIDPPYVSHQRDDFNRTRQLLLQRKQKPSSDHIGTDMYAAADEDSLAVSATSTINQLFGGSVTLREQGIILQQ
ncbi:glutathione hydrolase 5 proenzyme [Lates japonicus]|uniref:Glutathione hydrolase 5 proenzyme n=1 Tax=Lates japonicus TaxID=270547 RepID=A0AAD3NJY2_LATJO|nr:glutathione hydrolase 5 proenzyme [Lates japonicus]